MLGFLVRFGKAMSKRRLEGELYISHKDSPGDIDPAIVASMPVKGPVVKAGEIYESATFTCCHCQGIVVMNPKRSRPRNYCQKCDRYTCDGGVCVKTCVPMQKVFDDAMNAAIKGKVFLPNGTLHG